MLMLTLMLMLMLMLVLAGQTRASGIWRGSREGPKLEKGQSSGAARGRRPCFFQGFPAGPIVVIPNLNNLDNLDNLAAAASHNSPLQNPLHPSLPAVPASQRPPEADWLQNFLFS